MGHQELGQVPGETIDRGPAREQRGDSGVQRSATLFVRSQSKPGVHRTTHDLLSGVERLEARNLVADHAVSLIGEKVCCCASCAERPPMAAHLAAVEDWRTWSERAGVSLPLEESTVHSRITGEEHRYVRPPTATLVLRVAGEIETVLPHRIDGAIVSPGAFLEAALSEASEETSAHSIASSDAGGQTG